MFLLRENVNYDEKLKFIEAYEQSQEKYLENVNELSANYNELESKYQKLYENYQKLKDLKDGNWKLYEITAYTSNECGFITKLGIDLREDYSKNLNVCAVDPEVIPLGSIVLINFSDGNIKPYFACDTGSAIKGKIIDIYMTDVYDAIQFGRQNLLAKIIK
ncbi:3D domain-containing protein [bacterium]|nr:3D domain-containing protein [bacterium]